MVQAQHCAPTLAVCLRWAVQGANKQPAFQLDWIRSSEVNRINPTYNAQQAVRIYELRPYPYYNTRATTLSGLNYALPTRGRIAKNAALYMVGSVLAGNANKVEF